MAARSDEMTGVTGIIARWLDEIFKLPVGKLRIGLDPLISLIPVLGDILVSSAGAIIVLEAVRHRAPLGVLVRMGANMLANAALNLVPGVGPFVSVFFKSNSRNYRILDQWQKGQMHAIKRDSRRTIVGVVFLIVLVIILWAALGMAMIWGVRRLFGWG